MLVFNFGVQTFRNTNKERVTPHYCFFVFQGGSIQVG
jgi:hypothetical protein